MCLREDCSTIKDMTKGCEQEGYLPYFDENGKQQCYEEFSQVTFNPIRTGVFLGQSCLLSSKDFFEIYNFSVAQNLTILETNMRFC